MIDFLTTLVNFCMGFAIYATAITLGWLVASTFAALFTDKEKGKISGIGMLLVLPILVGSLAIALRVADLLYHIVKGL